MFNFQKNLYLSKELMEEESLSIKAKCLFAYIENVSVMNGKDHAILNQKELMQVLKIRSRETLRNVIKELEQNMFITVNRNKYTVIKQYIKEVV